MLCTCRHCQFSICQNSELSLKSTTWRKITGLSGLCFATVVNHGARRLLLNGSPMQWLRMRVWLAALGCAKNAAFDGSHCECENAFQRCKFSSFVIQLLTLCSANAIYILCLWSVICNLALAGLIMRIAVRNRTKRKRQRSRVCWGFRRNNSSCIVPTAFIIGHHRRRPRCPEHMPFLFVVFQPGGLEGNFLKGGGPKKSQSGKQLTELAQCVKQLTQAVGAIQAQLSGHDVPTETIASAKKKAKKIEIAYQTSYNQLQSPHCGTPRILVCLNKDFWSKAFGRHSPYSLTILIERKGAKD